MINISQNLSSCTPHAQKKRVADNFLCSERQRHRAPPTSHGAQPRQGGTALKGLLLLTFESIAPVRAWLGVDLGIASNHVSRLESSKFWCLGEGQRSCLAKICLWHVSICTLKTLGTEDAQQREDLKLFCTGLRTHGTEYQTINWLESGRS